MTKPKLPKTDSIRRLAEFWDTHDLTDFEGELEEVGERVFVRGRPVTVPLNERDRKAVDHMARRKGVTTEELIRAWVVQKLARRNNGRPR